MPERRVLPTLARIVDDLGPTLLRALVAPQGLDIAASEPVIFDPTSPMVLEEGDVVLGVGVLPDDAGAIDLVRTAGSHRATAVVIKLAKSDIPAPLARASHDARVAILAIPEETPWGHFHALLRSAIASAGIPSERTVAEGIQLGDLFTLANAVAAAVGGPVTIEDLQFRLRAYSNLHQPTDDPRRQTILGRRAPDRWLRWLHDRGVVRELLGSDDVVRVPGTREIRPRLAIAVRAGREVLGSLWVAEGDTALGEAAVAALREAAKVAALHLIRHHATEDLERRTRGELLVSLLEGREPLHVPAARLGIDESGWFSLVAFDLLHAPDADRTVDREKVLALAALYFEAFRKRAVVGTMNNVIYCVLPGGGSPPAERLMEMASDLVRRTDATLGIRMHAAIGPAVPNFRQLVHARREADQVLRVLRKFPTTKRVATSDDVHAHIILLELREFAYQRGYLRTGKLQALAESDARRGTSYVATLRAFFEAFGNIYQAADKINVHSNTLRYRLGRIEEISEINLKDPIERIIATLQLSFLEGDDDWHPTGDDAVSALPTGNGLGDGPAQEKLA